ncbi:DivIVA domain-containing protein [Streptomyces lonarensis]|uniref:DivIVA domain-containing protein n=1 Tax=Streptomyces lonarensis TaxID=700599 RepID=A0A7X6D175_9ACTN|nr:DivIVA domain-containing protein [Streptomyces lonarensis]NJQ06277.1 DivIVA domain-containing protein [Streptomyces lonarensis]
MFVWLMVAMVVVIGGVTLAVLGSGDGSGGPTSGGLPEAAPDRPDDPLPQDRAVTPADLAALRLPVAPRGYRMGDVDEVLDRLAAELADRDARIEELRVALAGAQAYAVSHDPGAAGDRTAGSAGAGPHPGGPRTDPPHHG